jgi:hypothetical protein
MLSLVGSIMLIGGTVALLERWLSGRNWIWLPLLLVATAQYARMRFAPGYCGTADGILMLVLVSLLGGYAFVFATCVIGSLLRRAAA